MHKYTFIFKKLFCKVEKKMTTKNISFLILFSVILSFIFFYEISSSVASDHGKKSYRKHHTENIMMTICFHQNIPKGIKVMNLQVNCPLGCSLLQISLFF